MDKQYILFIVLSYLVFFILIPPFQVPDEPEHYENIYWVSRLKYPFLPKNSSERPVLIVRKIIDLYDWNKVNSDGFVLPNFTKIKNAYLYSIKSFSPVKEKLLTQISSQAYHPPFYYIFGSFFYLTSNVLHLDIISQYYFVRLASTFFYFASIFIGYKVLKLIFEKQTDINNVLLFFAINPVTLKMGVGINNEIAVVFFSLFFLYFVLKISTIKTLSNKNILTAAVITGAAVLSKFSGIFTAFFWLAQNTRSSRLMESRADARDDLRRAQSDLLKRAIVNVLKYFLFLSILLLPWLAFNYIRYHNPIQDNFSIICKRDLPPYNIFQLIFNSLFEFRHTINHYAGFMGWGEPYPFKWFFVSYTIGFFSLFLIGLIRLIGKIGKRNDKNRTLLIYIFSLFLFLFILDLYRKSQHYSCDIQGRYLLPAFLPIAVVLERGLNSSKALAYFAIFQYYFILFFVLIPYYYV